MAFPVTCPACGKAFQLAQEIYERKVAGKIVSIKCKQCQAGIRVDATQPGELKVVGATPAGSGDLSVGPKPPAQAQPNAAPAASSEGAAPQAAPVRMRQPTLIGMMSPIAPGQKPAMPAAARSAATKPVLWAVDSGGTGDDRELSDEEIHREIEAGKLSPQTLAWREGMAEWLEIEKIPELARHVAPPAREEPKPSPARAAERPAPTAPALTSSAGFQDEPDGEATKVYDRSAPNAALAPFAAPPDQDVTARVMLGKTTPLADAPTPPTPAAGRPATFAKTTPLADPPPPPLPGGGRAAPFGKTMPLGSPGAPTAGRAAPFAKTTPLADPPPPPLPPAARPAPPAPAAPPPAPSEPRAAPPPAAAPPAAAPAAAPPPAVAPAPPLPRPPVQAPQLAAVPWGDALPSAKPASPALPTAPYGPDPFAIAASTDLDFPNPRSKKPLVIAAVVGVIAVVGIGIAIASSSSPPVANIAAPPPAPTTPPETPKTSPAPVETSEPERDAPRDPTTPATQPQAPSGNFSDLFSKGVENAKGSNSGAGAKSFDEAAARETLAAALKAAAACKEPGGPVGQTTATVTFDPNGSVSGVTVGAPFAGTSTGTCIITAFKRASVPAFSGLPKTVPQTISLM